MVDRDGCDLVLTTGGTEPEPRDLTPEATRAVIERELPGFGELMRQMILTQVPTAILSRQLAGARGRCLIVNLPGRPSSIELCLNAVFPANPYCLDLIGAGASRQVPRLRCISSGAGTDVPSCPGGRKFPAGRNGSPWTRHEAIRAINPHLIYCSILGYRQTGPAAERAAYAMIVRAESGFDRSMMRYAGDRDRPAAGAIFVADVLGGTFGYAAIQTALVQPARTGEGQRIDVALMHCMLNLLVYELQEAQFPRSVPPAAYGPVAPSTAIS